MRGSRQVQKRFQDNDAWRRDIAAKLNAAAAALEAQLHHRAADGDLARAAGLLDAAIKEIAAFVFSHPPACGPARDEASDATTLIGVAANLILFQHRMRMSALAAPRRPPGRPPSHSKK